jgi:hypothetical protein
MKKAKPERQTRKRAGVQACRMPGGIRGVAATVLHVCCTYAARMLHGVLHVCCTLGKIMAAMPSAETAPPPRAALAASRPSNAGKRR